MGARLNFPQWCQLVLGPQHHVVRDPCRSQLQDNLRMVSALPAKLRQVHHGMGLARPRLTIRKDGGVVSWLSSPDGPSTLNLRPLVQEAIQSMVPGTRNLKH